MKKLLARLYYGLGWFFKALFYLIIALICVGYIAMFWIACKGSILTLLKWIGLFIGVVIGASIIGATLSVLLERWESFARHELNL